MKTAFTFRKFLFSIGFLLLLIGFNSCSEDENDNFIPDIQPTGYFDVEEEQLLTGNTASLEKITVGQKSWLVAVNPGQEETHNFIAGPIPLKIGDQYNVRLTFKESAITNGQSGQVFILKLYEDAPNSGTPGLWDEQDRPIKIPNGELLIKAITVFTEDISPYFNAFDVNKDGFLDAVEVLASYYNKFSEWDADQNGSLSNEEFYKTSFRNTDADDDDGISEHEWSTGFSGMFSNWSEDDFETFDTNSDGILEMDEWNKIFKDSGWFESYDADDNTYVTEEEWDAGLFADWDADDNDKIDETEFRLYRLYIMKWHDDPESYTYEWYDTNKNGTLELQEAIETFIYSAWLDADQDLKLNSEEFLNTIFFNADYFYDETISKEEWDDGYTPLFGQWVEGNFSDFDKNNNGSLSKSEWSDIFTESGWFEAYDTNEDGFVTKEEWNAGLFAGWDVNDDNLIDEKEFDSYISYAFNWIRW